MDQSRTTKHGSTGGSRAAADAEGPLNGIRVLDVSTIFAGPSAAQILGDFGADVIKVEHPSMPDSLRTHGASKDGVGLWYKVVGRNKRTIGLYLGDREVREIFLDLIRTADVMIENFRPGTLEKWQLGWDVLREANPRLVLLRVTGFGQTGPYAQRPGFGTLAEAMSGFAAMTGEPDGPPTLPPFGLADGIAGYAGAAAVTMALYHRDTVSGRGQQIDLSILEPIVGVLGAQATAYDQLGIIPPRTGNRSTNNAPRNTYRTRDGHWIALSTSANAIARRLLILIGHKEVVDEPWFASGAGRATRADLLDGWVADWVAARDRDDVMTELEANQVAVAPVFDVAELISNEHVVGREVFVRVPDDDLGDLLMQNVVFRLSESPGAIRYPGRRPYADTDEVLVDELAIDPALIGSLRERGVCA